MAGAICLWKTEKKCIKPGKSRRNRKFREWVHSYHRSSGLPNSCRCASMNWFGIFGLLARSGADVLPERNGAESRTRTDDLLITNQFLAVLQDVARYRIILHNSCVYNRYRRNHLCITSQSKALKYKPNSHQNSHQNESPLARILPSMRHRRQGPPSHTPSHRW